jgi:copper(I)-binding protein
MTDTTTRRLTAAALASVLALGLAACGSGNDSTDTTDTADTGQTTSAAGQDSNQSSDALTFSDGYVGAKDPETEMTAVFGELTNTTDEDIHLTRVEGDLDGVYEFHETTDGQMRQTDDGLVIPAEDSATLEPGGHHIMIMENTDEIAAGDVLSLTLTAEDGATYELTDIPVRVQQSAHEDYGTEGTGDEHGDHAGH